MPRADYRAAVRRALAYIAAGDVYQVNLAQRFSMLDVPPPATVFARLQRQHPMPFAAYVDGGDFVLVSNSPECFLTRRGAQVATFPIKGTRPRGDGAAADAALRAELRTSAKEQAEHVMIVDLERNDLGRVCQTGTVTVPELAAARTFPSVHHLVSEVRGELRPGTTLDQLLRATFPGGSITGAPKIRAMEIIDELEPVARGFYTGAVGFVAASGDLVLNLAIRTGVATADGFTYHAGGGIVADSDPEREYEETLVKSRAFLAALDTEER
jgi:para-aminobenzoate synthetase component 1